MSATVQAVSGATPSLAGERRPTALLRRAIAASRPLFWLNSASLCVVAAILAVPEPGWRAALAALFATWPVTVTLGPGGMVAGSRNSR